MRTTAAIAALLLLALSSTTLLLSPFSIAHAQQNSVEAKLDKPFKLKIGQQAIISSDSEKIITIGFLNVTEDSRCPSDVVCIQQGQATVSISTMLNGTDTGKVALTIGRGEKSGTFGSTHQQYSIKLQSLEPYPVSTTPTKPEDYVATLIVSKTTDTTSANSAGVYIKAVGSSGAGGTTTIISGWNFQKQKGTLIMLNHDGTQGTKVAIVRFVPSTGQCSISEARECTDGRIVYSRGIQGDTIHLEISGNSLYLTAGGSKYTLDIKHLWTRPQKAESSSTTSVVLSEGQRDGPLLVQEIGKDYVKGLNYVEYPVARQEGIPITLHVGEKASNGCTVTLTLVKIQENIAIFSKTVEDHNKPCPL
jgi:hypothetical protein